MQNNTSRSVPIVAPASPRANTRSRKFWRGLLGFFERLPGYVFPLFLVALEWALRFAFQLSTQEFVGPTLASTGVGLTISLTSYKSRKTLENAPAEIRNYIEEHNYTVDSASSRFFRVFCWITTLVLTIFWVATLIISTKFATMTYWIFPAHYYLGFLSYILGFALSELKEVL